MKNPEINKNICYILLLLHFIFRLTQRFPCLQIVRQSELKYYSAEIQVKEVVDENTVEKGRVSRFKEWGIRVKGFPQNSFLNKYSFVSSKYLTHCMLCLLQCTQSNLDNSKQQHIVCLGDREPIVPVANFLGAPENCCLKNYNRHQKSAIYSNFLGCSKPTLRH